MHYFSFTFLFTILGITMAMGQQQLPVAVNFKKAYLQQTRNANGSPGKAYWQNKGSYTIKVTFDPNTNALSGNVDANYTNNSPDTLRQVIFKLYPNLYQAQAMRNVPVLPEDLTKGVEIKKMLVNNNLVDSKKLLIRGTNMYVKGVTILPGQSAHFDIDYGYQVNKTSFVRTGQVDTGAFMIAYFFPRIAVYDDIDGWNEYPYAGKEEFYNDYCDFKVSITLPGDYQVWATGELQNPAAVYKPEIIERIATAAQSDGFTDIITSADLAAHNITLNHPANTWIFEADNVTDFAFAASNHYVWKASSLVVDPKTKRRTRVDAVYNPQHKSFEPVVDYARKTVDLISTKVPGLPFPYPHETIFEGLDAMEYPMMVNNLPFEGTEAVAFTAHEIYHTLFPFLVGTNETKYSFMDEGWATFSEFTLQKEITPDVVDVYDLSPVNSSAGTDQDVPIMTLTPQLYGKARFSNKDLKPALGFHYVKEMLGDQLFYKAMNHYISQWQGKHPTPYDLFYCLNKGAGVDLNWFWQNWFFEKNVPDLAIEKVTHQQYKYTVVITRRGQGIIPVHLTIFYKDGATETISRDIACWEKGNRTITLDFTAKKAVSKLVLGDAYDADVDSSNNTWNNNAR
ncbi:MAG TPA: M1 family metallopeptidase [Chitinophaga sp.]|uniref:M1 family metallopeptidase n=1 Tax=Chitinophaga sp. TaxID=1869181 RepID=UPI002F9267A7